MGSSRQRRRSERTATPTSTAAAIARIQSTVVLGHAKTSPDAIVKTIGRTRQVAARSEAIARPRAPAAGGSAGALEAGDHVGSGEELAGSGDRSIRRSQA